MKKRAVLVTCFQWYENRLKYVEKYLIARGYDVTVVISDFDHLKKEYVSREKFGNNCSLIHVPAYKKNISPERCRSHFSFSASAAGIVAEMKPDFIWCLLPPNSLAEKMVRIKERTGCFLLFDVIDLWPESFPYGKTQVFPFSAWRNMRNRYLDKADRISLECAYYKETLCETVDAGKCAVFGLLKDPVIMPESILEIKQDIGLCYLGSMNSLIDLDVIESILTVITAKYSVVVRIIGNGDHKNKFLEVCQKCGAAVEDYGVVFDDTEKARLLCACSFALNTYKNNIKVGLSMKSVDYFQLGIPIINTIAGDTEKLVDRYKAGINYKDFTLERMETCMRSEKTLRENVKKLFDENFNSSRYEEILKGVIGTDI